MVVILKNCILERDKHSLEKQMIRTKSYTFDKSNNK